LITPSSIEKAEHCIETKVESLLVSNDNPSQVAPRTGAWIETDGIFSIPRNIRIRTSDFDDNNESFITIALLPVIIIGSTKEIWYCETALRDQSAQENVDEISGQILNMINEVKDTGIEGKIIIVNGYEVAEIISEMYDDQERQFEEKHESKNKTIRNRNGLKRIK
jgi:DNA-binding ferritin-like protein (Dps family)